MKLIQVFLLLAPFANAQFYVGQQQYRFSPSDPRCIKQGLCSYEEHRSPKDRLDYSINFIEVKDDGTLFDKDQLELALAQIEKARFEGEQKPIVFIYIHGWHNDAKEVSQSEGANCTDHLYKNDVAKFRYCGVAEVAKAYEPTAEGAPPRVVGIYLAWHGNDFNFPPLNIIPSYPIRRHFARKVGELGMADALHNIVTQIAKGGHRDDYFVIAMGHSFGSRVLETAAEFISKNNPNAGFMRRHRMATLRTIATSGEAPARPPVDLIFHVNAASPHWVSRTTISDWAAACATDDPPIGCHQHPLYLAVSSRADLVTSIVLPVANIVFFAPVTDRYHIIAAANTPWMQTNTIPKEVSSCPESLPEGSFCFHVDPPSGNPVWYEVDPKSGKTDAVFWAMNSDHWIAAPEAMLHSIPFLRRMGSKHWLISSHGDVWNPGVFALVRAVIQQEGAKRAF